MGHETSWDLLIFFFGGTFGGLCPLIGCICFFLRTLSVGGTPLHKLCTWLLLIFFFRRNFWRPLPLDRLHFFFRTMFFFVFRRNSTTQIMHLTSADFFFGGTQHHKMCSGLLLIQWFSLGFLLFFFFRRNSTSQMCAWVLLICMDFRRKFISLVTERPCSIFSHWLVTDPAAMDAMEEDWSEPEFQDTEFKVCPV